MSEIARCGECGVPSLIGDELRWEDGGVISLAQSPHNRMVFFESNIIDNVFLGVGELTGVPVEQLAVESRRRETRRFIERSFPFEVRNTLLLGRPGADHRGSPLDVMLGESIRRIRRDLSERVINVARIFGYGQVFMDWEGEDPYPWRSLVIRHPYSLPLWKADFLGTVEAFEGLDMWVKSEEIEEDVFRVEVFPGKHPVALSGRLMRRRRFEFKPGDVEYARCGTCGVPLEIASYQWDLERGVITAGDTGRRVAVFGPLSVEAVLDDLVAEHGPDVERAVIEAQRRFLKSKVDVELARRVAASPGNYLARRGMGYLAEMSGDRDSVSLRIANSCLHLFTVGLAQALLEVLFATERTESHWEVNEEGDLFLTISMR